MYMKFLCKSSKRKMQLIRSLENTATLIEERSKISEELEVSDFLINNMVQQLNDDFEDFGLEQEIQLISNKTHVILYQDGLVTSDVLLAHYLKRSVRYLLLKDIFFERLTGIYDFARLNYLSHSPVYKEFNILKENLAEFDFTISPEFKIEGFESEIREFMFVIFLKESYIDSIIFPDEVAKQIQLFQKLLIEISKIKEPSVRMSSRMRHYIGIVVMRLIHNHTEKQVISKGLENIQEIDFIGEIKNWLKVFFKTDNEEAIMRETEEIIRFLVVEGWLNLTVINSQHSYITKLNHRFIDYLYQRLDIPSMYAVALNNELNWIHYQLLTFPIVSKFEHNCLNVSYFIDSYPEYVSVCKDYLSQIKNRNILWENKEFLLYKYLIMLVSIVPLKEILKPCYICLDFSLGNQYNRMIKKNIEKILDMNIVFQSHVDGKTQLILSDLPIYKKQSMDYILWLDSPRPMDWANFIEKLFSIRKNEWKINETSFLICKQGEMDRQD